MPVTMSTPRAKRALNMGTPGRPYKRTKTLASTRRTGYRLIKPEMKHAVFTISHAGVTGSNTDLTNIAQGVEVNQRIAGKIKSWGVDILTEATVAHKIELLMPFDNSVTAPSNSAQQLPDRDEFSVLASYTCNPGADQSNLFQEHVSFPLGVVTTYNDASGSNRNRIYMRITTNGALTVNGQARIWYTDV